MTPEALQDFFARRALFNRLLPRLLVFADLQGITVWVAEVQRGEQQAQWNADHCAVWADGKRCELDHRRNDAHDDRIIGHTFRAIGTAKSLHRNGLAVDLLVMHEISNADATGWDWEQAGEAEAKSKLAILAEWWTDQDEDCRWGGAFDDPGHFSVTYKGRA